MNKQDIINGIDKLNDFNDINSILRVLLTKVQEHVVGYKKGINGSWVCVIEDGEYYIKTYEVLKSFGLATDHFTKNDNDEVVLFPDGKTLADMVSDPIGFNDWSKEKLL